MSDAQRADDKAGADLALTAARRTLQQTTRLVHQFLLLSSAEAYVATRTATSTEECCALVQTVLEDLAPQAHHKSMDLGFERSGSDTEVFADPVAFQEIVVNLVDNALRYTPAFGVVTVRIQSAPGRVQMQVEDSGPGVEPADRERIFERFFRLGGNDATGSGLGLAIVKELANQCGARIYLTSPAKGASGLVVTVEFFAE